MPASHPVSHETKRKQPSLLTVCLLIVHVLGRVPVRVIDIGMAADTMHDVFWLLLLLLPHLMREFRHVPV